MRVVILTVLTVLAVVYHGSQTSAESKTSMLGRLLLRRALKAMASKPEQIHVNRRSTLADESNYDDEGKPKDALEDIFAGSKANVDASGSRRNDVESQEGDEQQSSGSGESEVNTGSSSAGDLQADTSGQSSDEQQSQDESQEQTQQETAVDQNSGSSADEGSASQEQETDSGSASTGVSQPVVEQQQQQQAPQQTAEQSTVQVADTQANTVQVANTKKAEANEPVTVSNQDTQKDVNAAKKSEIGLVASAEAPLSDEESIEQSAASGESEDVSSGQTQTDEQQQDDGSAEAIRKGMESLTRLLKPVATGLDFQIYSGSSKPKEEEEDEDDQKSEEQKAVLKVIAKGEGDKEDEEHEDEQHVVEQKKEEPVKVKKCETVCAIPMTYQQCAVPRCEQKMGTIKDLCYFLCEHQKPHCRQECKEV